MKIASRFVARPDARATTVRLCVDDKIVPVRSDLSVAAALLSHCGEGTQRTPSGARRTAFCMMGVCFECLVELSGQPNTQACMVAVREGMVIRRQTGLRKLLAGGENG